MNKHCYRLIFSRTHGELRVVSELARSCSTEPGQRRGTGAPRLWVTLRRTVWLLGLAMFASPATAGIVADGRAAPGQRPAVIATQNGLPQVNIVAPNQAGVSHNQYQQFDVDQKGAILNNSARMTSTQMAGMIQGNPNLHPDAAPAKIILNEVNSNNPSQLRGFMEVAGGRAQVIVANPAGIICNGCGTINAGRMTLTTGKPQLNADGSLAGYQVERGVVRVEGGGLNGDARHDTEYVDVLARAVEINAGVWAKEQVSVVAGRNRVSADGVTATSLASDGSARPEVAIDMGQMGGMYSGHIRMVGTEAGIGVRNQGGHLQAAKTLIVTSEGKLSWQPGAQESMTEAGGDIQLTAREDIDHQGKLYSGGMLSVKSRNGKITHSGTLAAAGNVQLTAVSGIENHGNLLAGSDVNGQLVRDADLQLESQGDIQASGALLSKKQVQSGGAQVDVSGAPPGAGRITLNARQGNVVLRQAVVDSRELLINAAGDVDARQAQVRSARWDVSASQLFNQQAVWTQTGGEVSRFALSGLLDNSDGTIEAQALTLTSGALNNQRGRLVALDGAAQNWRVSGLLDNRHGELGSNGDLSLEAGRFNNQGGTIQSRSSLAFITGGDLDNASGNLLAGQALRISADGMLNNQSGTLTGDRIQLSAQRLNNNKGTLSSAKALTLKARQDIDNTQGILIAGENLNVNTEGELLNDGGTLQGSGQITLTAKGVSNQAGKILSGQQLRLTASERLDNRSGEISGEWLTLTTGRMNNAQGKVIARQALSLTALQSLNNTGGLLEAGSILNARSEGDWDNHEGTAQGGSEVSASAREFNNTGGRLQSAGNLTLDSAGDIINRTGKITAQNRLAVNWAATDLLDNDGGSLQSVSDLSLRGGQLNNRQSGLVLSQQTSSLDLAGDWDNRGGTLVGKGNTRVRAASLHNHQGKVHSGGILTLRTASLDNSEQGKISSQTTLDMQSDYLTNRDGGLILGTDNTSVTARNIDNRGGRLQSASAMTISDVVQLDNRQGQILANGALNIAAEWSATDSLLSLLNQQGQIRSGDALTLRTRTLDNQNGTLLGLRSLTLSAQQDYSRSAGETIGSNGTVTFSVSGVFSNLADWLLPGNLNLTAASIINPATLAGKTVALTTALMQNSGRLEADKLTLNVDTLDNAAALMGDHITVQGRVIDNHGAAAVIAATDSLTLRAGEQLLNRDGALLYSGDRLNLHSDDLIENRASSIEADGDVTIEAARLENLRTGLVIEREAEQSDYKWHRYNYYWRSYGSAVNTDKSSMASTTQQLTFQDDIAAQANPYGTLLAIDEPGKRAKVRVKNTQGQMIDLWINYLALKPSEDGSYAMTFYETRGFRQRNVPTPYQNTVWREHNIGRLEQWDPDKHIDIDNAPFVTDYSNFRERTVTGTLARDRLVSEGVGARILAGGNMTLHTSRQLLNDASVITANGNLTQSGGGQVENRGYSINERRQEVIVDHYDKDTQHWYPTFNLDETTALTTIDGVITGNGNVAINGASITNTTDNQAQISQLEAALQAVDAERAEYERNPLAFTAEEAAYQTGDMQFGAGGTTSPLRHPLLPAELALTALQHLDKVATSIPDNSLFRQQVAPGSPFLVVTDERFTSRDKFISSDYLLSRVGYDPSQAHKRLGDGFYEQRLVREQVLALTGKPSVKGWDAMEQYQQLMNNGSKVAQDFHLEPGVALTPEQIAALQQDIVWLVSETVDTASGSQTVWLPKVYLAPTTLRLTGDGAVIGGGNLQLSAESVTNAGNLFADKALSVDAGSFLHQGGDISADSISVQADTLAMSTNLQDALRQATMNAADITLGGTDIRLVGAKLDATGDLNLSARNSLDILAATSSRSADLEVISGAMGNRTNSGMEEAGSRMAHISGEWQQASGSELKAGGNLSLTAGQDITLRGSQASAGGTAQLQAGGDIRLMAETTTNRTHLEADSSTSSVSNSREEDRLLLSTLSGDRGVRLVAGQQLEAKGAQVDSQQGAVGISANDIHIGDARQFVSDQDSEQKREGSTKSSRESLATRESSTGSTFSSRQGVTAIAREGDITLTGSTLHSEQGAVALQAKNDVLLASATESEMQFSESHASKKGGLSSSSHTLTDDRSTREKGSLLSGESVTVLAGHDLTVNGSAVAADQDVRLQAGNNVDIHAATETESHYLLEEKKKSGLLSSGGIGFTIGTRSERHELDEKDTTQSQSVSTIGSSQGSVSVTAGNQLHIGGADLIAGRDLSLTGDSVKIDPGFDQRTRTETFESKQSGVSVALSGTAGSALNTAVGTAQQARKESDSRLSALQNIKAGLSGAQALQAQRKADASGQESGSTFGVSISIGAQSSASTQRQEQSVSSGSTLTAGHHLSITATGHQGGASSGDIDITGSQLKAAGDATLDAARDLRLSAAADTQQTEGSNSSHGGSVGVSLGVGQNSGFSVFASGNASRGSESGNGTFWNETTLDSGGEVRLHSGRDSVLSGAQVSGETVTADVGRNLTVQSLQDSERYDAKQSSVSGGISIPIGAGSGSANISVTKDALHSNFDSVKEQSGLFAGAGGYNIRVEGHTQLDGGVIGSTAMADKNRLETGTLGWNEIHNQAEYTAKHSGGSFSTGGPVGANLLAGMAGGVLSGVNSGGEASGTTRAAVSEGTIVIRDPDNQQQDVAALSRDVAHANDGSISPIFDREKEQNRLKAAQLIAEAGMQAADIARSEGEIAGERAKRDPNKLADARAQLEREGKAFTDRDVEKLAYDTALKPFGTGSAVQRAVQAATAAVQGLAGGNIAQAVSGAAAPYLAEQIHIYTADNPEAKAMAHAVVGAVASYTSGNAALAGAAGAVSGELMAQLVMKELYPGKAAGDLSETQRQTVSALGTLAAGLAGAVAGDGAADAVAGAQAGRNAVENNSLSGDQARATAKQAAEFLKNQVREKLGEGTTSAIANAIINGLADTGDAALGGADYAADAAMALASCAARDGYCDTALKDLAGKNQAVADSVKALMSSDTWSAVADTIKQASEGNQVALEAAGGMLAGIILPGKKVPGTLKAVDPTIKIATGQAVGVFEKSLANLPPGERIAIIKQTAPKVAAEHGMVKDNQLTKKNGGRDVYRGQDGNLYALDTQHGRFEVVSPKGKHLGEVDFSMQVRKPADLSGGHNLKVK